jgi:hypothetical protein
MVAFAGSDPIGVLIGAKRPAGTLIHRIAVHPDHRRQGHGRHLLDSLRSKLAILGPPRIVAEVPETLAPACALFDACGYVAAAVLTDHVRQAEADDEHRLQGEPSIGAHATLGRLEGFLIPVSIDDLAANGLLPEADSQMCWERSLETLVVRKDQIAGLAVASDERIEAYLLYSSGGAILSLRSFVEDGGTRLGHLLSRTGMTSFRLSKAQPAEIPPRILEALGFRAAGRHVLYATTARPE